MSEILQLPVTERLAVAEAIWESLSAEPDSASVPLWHLDEVKRRLETFRANPEGTQSWSDLKARLSEEFSR